jgi:uncharacterized FAD-dependent dehydrogenase
MCPGGEVIAAASECGGVTSNGMSDSARDGAYANSAILVDVGPADFGGDHPLAGVAFQRGYERAAFLCAKNRTSSLPERRGSPSAALLPTEALADFFGENSVFEECLPVFALRAIRGALPVFGGRIQGFDAPTARLYGPETRSSSPVRIPRGSDGMSNITGVYPAGEGAGYAGGILSAAVDGLRAAEHLFLCHRQGAGGLK